MRDLRLDGGGRRRRGKKQQKKEPNWEEVAKKLNVTLEKMPTDHKDRKSYEKAAKMVVDHEALTDALKEMKPLEDAPDLDKDVLKSGDRDAIADTIARRAFTENQYDLIKGASTLVVAPLPFKDGITLKTPTRDGTMFTDIDRRTGGILVHVPEDCKCRMALVQSNDENGSAVLATVGIKPGFNWLTFMPDMTPDSFSLL